jgi:PPOX class probable F420-dependent enzyme
VVELAEPHASFLRAARTAYLATAGEDGQPHVIPICFVFDGRSVYSVLDRKPKNVPAAQLRRVRNISANPKVSLVVDHYDEEWSRLRYVLVFGRAELLTEGDELVRALELLREKYAQYREMDLTGSPVIKIAPERFVPWSFQPYA